MSKIIMTLRLPEPKTRKKTAKAIQPHKDKTKYRRKAKHQGPWTESQGPLTRVCSHVSPAFSQPCR
jgi:hypothetical protein